MNDWSMGSPHELSRIKEQDVNTAELWDVLEVEKFEERLMIYL